MAMGLNEAHSTHACLWCSFIIREVSTQNKARMLIIMEGECYVHCMYKLHVTSLAKLNQPASRVRASVTCMIATIFELPIINLLTILGIVWCITFLPCWEVMATWGSFLDKVVFIIVSACMHVHVHVHTCHSLYGFNYVRSWEEQWYL